MKNGLCFTQNVFILDFFVQIRNQLLKIVPVPNFSQIGQKIRKLEFRPENCLMTSANFYGFGETLSQSTIMPSVVVIEPQIKEKQRGDILCPQLIFYQNIPA